MKDTVECLQSAIIHKSNNNHKVLPFSTIKRGPNMKSRETDGRIYVLVI